MHEIQSDGGGPTEHDIEHKLSEVSSRLGLAEGWTVVLHIEHEAVLVLRYELSHTKCAAEDA